MVKYDRICPYHKAPARNCICWCKGCGCRINECDCPHRKKFDEENEK